jgi:uncharacterized protein
MAMIVRERFRLARMTKEFAPGRLDVVGFAAAAASLSGDEALARFGRLVAELATPPEGRTVRWTARGEERSGAQGEAVPWLHLEAETLLPLSCQRCLAPVEVGLLVDRWFRFAPDEATAALEDETADEDVLALSRDFDLYGLIEDELLMEIPITPRHEQCPQATPMSAADPAFEAADAARPNPFAVLGELRKRKAD